MKVESDHSIPMQTSPRLLYIVVRVDKVLTSAQLAVVVKSEGGGVMGCRVWPWVEAETLPLMQTQQHLKFVLLQTLLICTTMNAVL